jgi:polyisoprenoid-binding protein YceI
MRVGANYTLKKHHSQSPVAGGASRRQSWATQGIPPDKMSASRVSFGARAFPLISFLLLAMVWPARTSAQVPGSYRVDTKASHVEIHLFPGGFLSGLGDNHLIAITHLTGSAQLSGNNPWWVRMLAEADSLKVLDPWGSKSSRQEVEDTMLGPDQLDVKHFPSIKLNSTSIVPGQQATDWRLLAEVTLHGVTRQVEFPLDCQQIGDQLHVRGKKDLRLLDFDIQPISKVFGAVKVKNEFEVTYDITLDRNY